MTIKQKWRDKVKHENADLYKKPTIIFDTEKEAQNYIDHCLEQDGDYKIVKNKREEKFAIRCFTKLHNFDARGMFV